MLRCSLARSFLSLQIEAVKAAFAEVFDSHADIQIEHVVPEGVNPQPTSDFETQLGALKRACYAKNKFPDWDFYVGVRREFFLP